MAGLSTSLESRVLDSQADDSCSSTKPRTASLLLRQTKFTLDDLHSDHARSAALLEQMEQLLSRRSTEPALPCLEPQTVIGSAEQDSVDGGSEGFDPTAEPIDTASESDTDHCCIGLKSNQASLIDHRLRSGLKTINYGVQNVIFNVLATNPSCIQNNTKSSASFLKINPLASRPSQNLDVKNQTRAVKVTRTQHGTKHHRHSTTSLFFPGHSPTGSLPTAPFLSPSNSKVPPTRSMTDAGITADKSICNFMGINHSPMQHAAMTALPPLQSKLSCTPMHQQNGEHGDGSWRMGVDSSKGRVKRLSWESGACHLPMRSRDGKGSSTTTSLPQLPDLATAVATAAVAATVTAVTTGASTLTSPSASLNSSYGNNPPCSYMTASNGGPQLVARSAYSFTNGFSGNKTSLGSNSNSLLHVATAATAMDSSCSSGLTGVSSVTGGCGSVLGSVGSGGVAGSPRLPNRTLLGSRGWSAQKLVHAAAQHATQHSTPCASSSLGPNTSAAGSSTSNLTLSRAVTMTTMTSSGGSSTHQQWGSPAANTTHVASTHVAPSVSMVSLPVNAVASMATPCTAPGLMFGSKHVPKQA